MQEMELSVGIARVLGPVLVLVTVSEVLNARIWKGISPAQVQMNGMILFAAAGAGRMIRPEAPQAEAGPAMWIVSGLLCLLGVAPCWEGWGPAAA